MIECKLNVLYTKIIPFFFLLYLFGLNIFAIFGPFGFSNQNVLSTNNGILKFSFAVVILKQYCCLFSVIALIFNIPSHITMIITNRLFIECQDF